MKNLYQMLNDAQGAPESYEDMPLNDLETQKIKQHVHQAKGKKHRSHSRRWAAVACCALFLGVFSQTATAERLMERLVKTIQMEYISVNQYEAPDLGITLYDKDGNPITDFTNFQGNIYDEKGLFLDSVDLKSLPAIGDDELMIQDLEALQEHLCFDYYFPSYLPEGYKFEYATVWQDSDQYVNFYFTDDTGGYLFMQQRELTEETAYESGTDGVVEEVTVNGYKAALSNGSTLDWEYDGVAICLASRGLLSTEDLMKMAESLE